MALSPDRPEKLQETVDKNALTYKLISDNKLSAASAYGLAFRLDDETAERYKGFGIDLVAASGETHQGLPVPAVFVLNENQDITYVYANPDYKVRVEASEVLEAAQAAAARN